MGEITLTLTWRVGASRPASNVDGRSDVVEFDDQLPQLVLGVLDLAGNLGALGD